MAETIPVVKEILSANDQVATENRRAFDAAHVFTVNLMASPGAGKTSLILAATKHLPAGVRPGVIEGDVASRLDADAIAAHGIPVVQINTGGACHLDARMVSRVLPELDVENMDLLFVENVGNLVCPSSYDLGEDMKVVVISTTEGDDKPLKYPAMFRRSSVMVINKIDLLGTSDFDMEKVKANARSINIDLRIFDVSCRTGEGLESWFAWLREFVAGKKQGNGGT